MKVYHQVFHPTTGEILYMGTMTECRAFVLDSDEVLYIDANPTKSSPAIKEILNTEYHETLAIQEMLSRLPKEHRGYLLLAIAVGKGEGEGAELFREYAKTYLRVLQQAE